MANTDDFQTKVSIGGSYKASNFERSTGGSAVFSGTGYGIQGEIKAGKKRYGIGVKLSLDKLQLENTSNSASASERLENTCISIVPRLYALDLYFGLGVTYDTIRYERSSLGQLTTENYSGPGIKIELGFDWFLGKTLFLNPELSYQISRVRAESSVGNPSFNSFGAAVKIGLAF
jgi:hypothetical protein